MLCCVTALLISCGGSKKTTRTTTKTKTVSSRKTQVSREVTSVEKPKEVAKKPLAKVSYKEKVQNYIFEYASIAKHEMQQYGIPASITLAQGILESGAGYGELTSKAKNHFGIKCHDWKGDRVYHDDDRSQECFRKYEKASESFRDHSLFLKNRKRYSKLFTYKQSDYKSWAYGLRAAGYATDKKYPVKLISIIERYKLYDYDAEVLGTSYVAVEPKKVEKKKILKTKNGEYIVQKGDTLYSISRRYNLKVSELKAYNNLKDNAIAIGQVLKVEKPEDDADEF